MLKGLHPEYGRKADRLFRLYLSDPEQLEEDMCWLYNAKNGLRDIRKLMLPKLKESIDNQDLFSFAVYSTFLPRLWEAYS